MPNDPTQHIPPCSILPCLDLDHIVSPMQQAVTSFLRPSTDVSGRVGGRMEIYRVFWIARALHRQTGHTNYTTGLGNCSPFVSRWFIPTSTRFFLAFSSRPLHGNDVHFAMNDLTSVRFPYDDKCGRRAFASDLGLYAFSVAMIFW